MSKYMKKKPSRIIVHAVVFLVVSVLVLVLIAWITYPITTSDSISGGNGKSGLQIDTQPLELSFEDATVESLNEQG